MKNTGRKIVGHNGRGSPYAKYFDSEMAVAQEVLANFPGEFAYSKHQYQIATFQSEHVNIIFYPHRAPSHHYTVRVRNNGSRIPGKAREIILALQAQPKYQHTTVFHCKNMP